MAEGGFLLFDRNVHPVEGIVAPISCDVRIIRGRSGERSIATNG